MRPGITIDLKYNSSRNANPFRDAVDLANPQLEGIQKEYENIIDEDVARLEYTRQWVGKDQLATENLDKRISARKIFKEIFLKTAVDLTLQSIMEKNFIIYHQTQIDRPQNMEIFGEVCRLERQLLQTTLEIAKNQSRKSRTTAYLETTLNF